MSTIMSLHDALEPLGLSRPGQQVEGLKLPRFSTCQPLVLLQSFIGLEPLATSAGALKGVDDRVPGFEVLIVMDS